MITQLPICIASEIFDAFILRNKVEISDISVKADGIIGGPHKSFGYYRVDSCLYHIQEMTPPMLYVCLISLLTTMKRFPQVPSSQ